MGVFGVQAVPNTFHSQVFVSNGNQGIVTERREQTLRARLDIESARIGS
jgi:hypothetical protein